MSPADLPFPVSDNNNFAITLWNDLDFSSPFDHLDIIQSPDPKQPSPDTPDSYSIQSRYHAGSDSGSDTHTSNPVLLDPVHIDPDRTGCDDSVNILVSVMEERKQRRKESNRISAKKSRTRKQQQLEALRGELDRLETESREKTNQLEEIVGHCHRVLNDNNRLRAEAVVLRRSLSEIGRILELRRRMRRRGSC
ncbi:hypothetical protein Droror1_Dr00005152 [Drosera rotundifolia]